MIRAFGAFSLPLLRWFDPEDAHRLAIQGLRLLPPIRRGPDDPKLAVRAFGLNFPNPVGMAAGFDKSAEVPDALLRLGFGFVEIGTVTPLPQPGNPRPRIFRLLKDKAIINRLGFNNDGHDAVHLRLSTRRSQGVVGVNIGANRDSPDRIGDYVAGVTRFDDVADYLTINISSPNTPGLRDLQERGALAALLIRVVVARDAAPRRVPVFLKIAPDLDQGALEAVAEEALSAGVDGIIVSNTTTARDELIDRKLAAESGGLSGRPLFRRSTIILGRLRKIVGKSFFLIGAGGIDSSEAAWDKIAAGANLIQIYAGLVYEGPGIASRICQGFSQRLAAEGMASISEVVGIEADHWANAQNF